MAATQRLELRQSQSLVMTPQLQQAIKLLQLSNAELVAYVESELERNPLLERDDDAEVGPAGDDAAGREGSGEAAAGDDPLPPSEADSLDRLSDLPDASPSNDAPLDTDYENLYNHDSPSDTPYTHSSLGISTSTLPGRGAQGDDEQDFESPLSQAITLRQHLVDQLQIAFTDPVDRIIAMHLIDMLDEAGYLVGDTGALEMVLGVSAQRIEETLVMLQGLEPTGVFARSLSECLALQLSERDRLDPAMQALLANLDLLAKADFASLQRICGVDREDLSDMLAEIRALNPKPGLDFAQEPTHPLVPDVLMRPVPGDKWLIELNSETLPRVLVNQSYYGEVSRHATGKADREYLSEHLSQANWLVKALHQRATTILKVAREIVKQQDAFFRKGVEHLRPLTLKDVAQAVDLHESTVSRVTSNKYIATPRGTFEFKYFFTAAIAGADGALHSAESVRYRIKALIDAESGSEILSDDTIVEILRREGVEIARRTVAKYRDTMRIPSSVQRRREKARAS